MALATAAMTGTLATSPRRQGFNFSATSAVRCGKSLDGGFNPYQSTCLSRARLAAPAGRSRKPLTRAGVFF